MSEEDSRYYPFNGGAGASVSENDWAEMVVDWAATGVRLDMTEDAVSAPLLVTQSGSSAITVSPGSAKVRGFHYKLNSALTITHDANSTDDVERIDLISVTLDQTGATSFIGVTVRKGNEAAYGSAVPPNPLKRWDGSTGTPGVYDLPIGSVTVRGSSAVASLFAVASIRQFLGGSIEPVLGGIYPLARYDGQLVYDRDNRRYQSYNASANKWETLSDMGASRAYLPSMVGNTNSKFAIRNGRYKVIGGNICQVSLYIKVGTANVSGAFNPSLPFAAAGGYSQIMPLFWRDNSTSDAKRIGIAEVNSGSSYFTTLHMTKSSSADLDTIVSLGSNDELRITGSYEIAT